MPIANVLRVSIMGAMPNGEVWSVNPVWQIGGVSTAEDISAEQAQTMATAVANITVPTGLLLWLTNSCSYTGCRVEARRWDGTLSTQAEAFKAVPTPGTSSTAHPFQTAAVVSLRTAGVGASGRGRLYFPATGAPSTIASLRPSVSAVSSFLSAAKTYLTSITAALDVTTTNSPVLSVWSRQGASTLPVTTIQAGDVLDTQRRRRDGLLESYSTLAFP